MIPTVLSLFGLVIGSFLNAVVHWVTLRMRDVTMGGMLGRVHARDFSGDRERCSGSFSGRL